MYGPWRSPTAPAASAPWSGAERLLGSPRPPTMLRLLAGQALAGEAADVGLDWCCCTERVGRSALVPIGAVLALSGLTGAATTGSAATMARRFGFGHALRGLSRDRAVVALADVGGGAATGTIDAVGADAPRAQRARPDEPRRPENITGRGASCRSRDRVGATA